MINRERASGFARLAAVLTLSIGGSALLASCDQFSPTQVINPNLTDEQFLKTPDAARTWLRGVERQFMQTVNTLVTNVELVSDNYFNNYTTNSKVFDLPRIDYHDTDNRSMQQAIARLREGADFGLTQAIPADATVTETEEAEFLFYRAMASIFAGEHFVGLPQEARGPIVGPEVHLDAAVTDLIRARDITLDADRRNGYTLALARAYYRLGDRASAVREAEALLAAAPAFLRSASFDGVSGPGNSMQGLLTGSTNNYQPLPRLDFLDPKFPNRGPQIQSPLAFLKAEEAHLILAEAALSTGDLAGATARLLQLLALVDSRPREMVDGRLQQRGRAGGTVIYPNQASVRVAFAPDEPLREGLVLTRDGDSISVPVISGTSVTREQIGALNSHDEALYVLYLMRQEIFLGEGRRSTDLGIRFPVSYAEVLSNDNAVDGAAYTTAMIPAFIPGNLGMDAFDYDEAAGTVVIHHDMNRLIVQNPATPGILPFH